MSRKAETAPSNEKRGEVCIALIKASIRGLRGLMIVNKGLFVGVNVGFEPISRFINAECYQLH